MEYRLLGCTLGLGCKHRLPHSIYYVHTYARTRTHVHTHTHTGEEAVKAKNVFYYLTYTGAINLDSVTDANLRKVGLVVGTPLLPSTALASLSPPLAITCVHLQRSSLLLCPSLLPSSLLQGLEDHICHFGQTPSQLLREPHPARQTLAKVHCMSLSPVCLSMFIS